MQKKTNKKTTDFKSINSVEDAFKALNIDYNEKLNLSNIPERFRETLEGFYELLVGFEAVNGKDITDYADHSTWKYEPRHWVDSSGVRFGNSSYFCTSTGTCLGSRLCTLSAEKTLHEIRRLNLLSKK